MVVALDMQESELRDMLTEIRLIKDEGNHTTMNGLPFLTDAELSSPQVLDPVTITHVLPKKYPTGTLTFDPPGPAGAPCRKPRRQVQRNPDRVVGPWAATPR
jgi:hypothetical protein